MTKIKPVIVITVGLIKKRGKKKLLNKTRHNCTTTVKTSLYPCHNGANTSRRIPRVLLQVDREAKQLPLLATLRFLQQTTVNKHDSLSYFGQ